MKITDINNQVFDIEPVSYTTLPNGNSFRTFRTSTGEFMDGCVIEIFYMDGLEKKRVQVNNQEWLYVREILPNLVELVYHSE